MLVLMINDVGTYGDCFQKCSNEKMDATHLAEFHQIEGIIIGPDLTLGAYASTSVSLN